MPASPAHVVRRRPAVGDAPQQRAAWPLFQLFSYAPLQPRAGRLLLPAVDVVHRPALPLRFLRPCGAVPLRLAGATPAPLGGGGLAVKPMACVARWICCGSTARSFAEPPVSSAHDGGAPANR